MYYVDDCAPNAPSAFAAYSDLLRRNLMPAKVVPLVDSHRPDDPIDGAYVGTVGAFQAPSAIVAPNGQWAPTYTGIVPVTAQQQITAPDPWLADDGQS